jgi:hypothetical protein
MNFLNVEILTRNISKDNENPKIPVPIICFIFTDWNLTITNRCPESTVNDGTSKKKFLWQEEKDF